MATAVPQTRASQAELPSLNLKELNKTSCRVGQWTVRVVRPEIQRYDYLVNGKTVQGQKLQCLLVSEDAEIYKCNVSISAPTYFFHFNHCNGTRPDARP